MPARSVERESQVAWAANDGPRIDCVWGMAELNGVVGFRSCEGCFGLFLGFAWDDVEIPQPDLCDGCRRKSLEAADAC